MRFPASPLVYATLILVDVWIGASVAPCIAVAQEPRNASRLYDENEVGHDIRALQARYGTSRFRLFGQADLAVTSLKPTGTTAYGRGMEYFVTNTGIIDAAGVVNMDFQPDIATGSHWRRPSQWFEVSPIYAAPRSEWERFVRRVPSLANARGGGYAVSRNSASLGLRELFAADGEFGTAFSGVQSTDDGSCRDQTSDATSNISPGQTLLAGSDCPPTWPLVDGVPTFRGRHPVSAEAFLAAQAAQGSEFNFEWWRVDESLIDRSKLLGNFQTYGAYDDYNSAMIGRFGDVVPGGLDDPEEEGWPLGLRTEFDAFYFRLPTVANSMFWRAEVINETEKVYGVGLDYEKLYLGYTLQPARFSESTFYLEVWRGAMLSAEGGTSNPYCPGVDPPGASFIDCEGGFGFSAGITAQIVLKSPLGDLRNVLFTCDPADSAQRAAERAIPCPTAAFHDPANVHAGDTVTYNHFRMCPYGAACGYETLEGPDRQMFGAIASNHEDVLNGRDIARMYTGFQYAMFRNPNYPQQPTPFAYWVPGSWDYTANGPTPGGDTIYVPTCYGPPGVAIHGTTRENRADACVVTWSDTMPVGELGNPAYNNQEGNVSYWSLGPFALAAGDTTALVIALVAEADSAAFEAEVNNVIDLYMKFYLKAEPPPKVSVAGVDVQLGAPPRGLGHGRVTLFWDDASDDYIDPFLEDFADKLAAAPDLSRLGRLRALNPDLEAEIRVRARDNLERILIYKSCDGGTSFTTNDTDQRGLLDCDGEPTRDSEGNPLGTGWAAFAVLPVDSEGEAPNSFVDSLVLAGQSYLYVIAGESRAASFLVDDSLDTDGDWILDAVRPDSLSLAPSLINPLIVSEAEPNVVSVYVPASLQAGGSLAVASFLEPDPARSTAPFAVSFIGSEAVGGRYRALFANQFELVEVGDGGGGVLSTRVVARDTVRAVIGPDTAAGVAIDSLVLTTENPNGVSLAGVPSSVTTSGDTTATVLHGLGFVLCREINQGPATAGPRAWASTQRAWASVRTAAEGLEPLLVSTLFDAERTTPVSFVYEREATGSFTGFPGFIVGADNRAAGDFERQEYRVNSGGAPIPSELAPTLSWDDRESDSNQKGGISAYGRYEVTFVDYTFGPGAPFELNLSNPEETQSAFDASIAARQVGSTGRVDQVAADAIWNAWKGRYPSSFQITVDDLVAVRVPFQVRNTTFERNVELAMLRRDAELAMSRGASDAILLGDPSKGDTLSVTVPADAWAPGDELYLLETMELDSLEIIEGQPAVVLQGGKPIKLEKTVATFAPATLNCLERPRPSCNPVVGPGSTADWISNVAGQRLAVFYVAPFQLASEIVFDVVPAIVGQNVIDRGQDIRAQMDSINAVPNPYIFFSEYQISGSERRLLFTHLPPQGVLRIFTVSGQFVQEIRWGPSDLVGNGDLFWDLRTREGFELGAGLYVFVVEARNPATGGDVKKIGKFVVIR